LPIDDRGGNGKTLKSSKRMGLYQNLCASPFNKGLIELNYFQPDPELLKRNHHHPEKFEFSIG
jgi:hypothetical protein